MPNPSVDDIVDAVETVLETTGAINTVRRDEEMKEGVPYPALVELYHQREETDPSGTASMTSFGTGHQSTWHILHIDVYARRRSELKIDMQKQRELLDAIRTTLRTQQLQPFFDLAGIVAFRWNERRVVFERGKPVIRYAGSRFELWLRVMRTNF